MKKALFLIALLGWVQISISQNFSPLEHNPALWLDASNASSIVQSGGVVSAWNDISGYGNHTVQTELTNRPNYVAATESIDFDGTNDILLGTNLGYGTDDTMTLFVVASPNAGSEAGSVIAKGQWTSKNDYRIELGENGYDICIQDGRGWNGSLDWNIAHKNLVHTYYDENNQVGYYLNGAQDKLPNTSDGTYTPNSNPFSIGGRFNYSDFFDGKIHEIIYFQNKLTACQIKQVEGYLYHKWNMENYIISSHPYKNNPFGICDQMMLNVDENSSNGTVIGALEGTYVDTPVAFSDWRIESSDLYPETFNLSNNGELTVQDGTFLDFETISALNIQVSALSNGIRVYGAVIININDLPDGGVQKTHSELWGVNGEKWDPRGRLPDFSYVGYKSGEESYSYGATTVDVTNFGAIPNDNNSDVAAIRNAIASINSGIVYFPAGVYIIDDFIEIIKNNIVLRGAGNNATTGTKFYFPFNAEELGNTSDSVRTGGEGYMIVFAGVDAGASYYPTEETRMGDRSITLNKTSGLSIGDYIGIIYAGTNPTDGELWDHLMNNQNQDLECTLPWATGNSGLEMYHTIERIDGKIVTLKEPLRLDLRLSWSPKLKLRSGHYIENCGVEDIYMEHKYIPLPAHKEEPGYNGIGFTQSFNCWVNNVSIENSDNGIQFKRSAYGEIINLTLEGRPGHHGWGFAYSSHCLAKFHTFNNTAAWRHSFTLTHKANGNVVSNVTGLSGIPINTDFHRNAPWETLITELDNDWNYKSSGKFCAGPHAGKRTVYWNMGGDGFTAAPKWDDYQTTLVGNMRIPEKFDSEKGWHENVPNIEPSNLYDAQLNRRLTLPKAPLFTEDAQLGDRESYRERDPSRWKIKDGAYELFFSKTPELKGNRLGEYTILNENFNGNMLITSNISSLEKISINAMANAALIINFQNDTNYYFSLISANTATSGIYKVSNGISTLIKNLNETLTNVFTSYSFENNAGTLMFYKNGNLVDTIADETFTGGKVGFGSLNDAVSFDDILLTLPTNLSVEDKFKPTSILAYPNPVSNILTVNSNNVPLKSIQIIDLNGRILNKNRNKQSISFASLAEGIYIVQIVTELEETVSIKIVKGL